MSAIITGEAVVLELRPASFGARALGAIIDVAVEIAVFVAALLLLSALSVQLDPAAASVAGLVLALLCFVAAPVAVETVTRGKSLGKLALGLRIVRIDGGAIRFRHALIRGLLGLLELVLTLGTVAFVTSLFNPRSQRLGDLLAGTYSLRERLPAVSALVLDIPEGLRPWTALADIGRIPDGLGRRISAFLRQASRMAPASRLRLAESLAAEAAAAVAPAPPAGTPAEGFLIALMAERRNRELRTLTAAQRRFDLLNQRMAALPFDQ